MKRSGPQAGPDQPRRFNAGQFLRGAFVYDYFDIGVLLQAGRRRSRIFLAFDDILDYGGFLLAPGHQDDPFGFEDRSEAHRDRFARHVVDPVKDR